MGDGVGALGGGVVGGGEGAVVGAFGGEGLLRDEVLEGVLGGLRAGRVGEVGHERGPQRGEQEALVLAREQALLRDVVREEARRGRGRGDQRTGGEHLGRGGRRHAARQHQVHVVARALEHLWGTPSS